MAQTINEQAYANMISALGLFSSAIYEQQSRLQSTALICKGEVDDEDGEKAYEAIKAVCSDLVECQEEANRIAKALQQELDEFIQERKRAWESDGQ